MSIDKVFTGLMAVATVVLGVASAQLFSQVSQNNELFSRIGAIDEKITNINARIDSTDKNIGAIKASMLVVQKRLTVAETDPIAMLANMGIEATPGFTAAFVKGRVYLFPVTGDAEQKLIQAGFHQEQITPVLAGYTIAP